jgi:hypothetical protein
VVLQKAEESSITEQKTLEEVTQFVEAKNSGK